MCQGKNEVQINNIQLIQLLKSIDSMVAWPGMVIDDFSPEIVLK